MWAKVRQLTCRSKHAESANHKSDVTAAVLNSHYASVSTNDSYIAPSVKHTAINESSLNHIAEWRMFDILDNLRPTSAGLDDIPAWFLRIGAPLFAKPIAAIMNLSLSSAVVPQQWKKASILPIPKIPSPQCPSDFRPISITSILSRILERIVVADYIYPALQSSPPDLNFSDQYAFRPSGSTTAALIQLFYTVTTQLDTNSYVVVYALDFSKAFDSIRHKSVLDKYLRLEMPDNIYNWIQAFFNGHSHCTRLGDSVSDFLEISASIIQGSGIGPASYTVAASDLCNIVPGNTLIKYADDTYLIIPASNIHSCSEEIANVEQWAMKNNLKLNRVKSSEIVFVSRKSRRHIEIPPPAIPDFERVDEIKALGVTVNRKFSLSSHVDNLLTACSQTLFALRTLRSHGLNDSSIQAIFQATVVAKLTYAAPAWWGFTSAADRDRLEAFLRRSVKFGYRSAASPSLASVCEAAEKRLFRRIQSDNSHVLHPLLPPVRESLYNLRDRPHNYQLPARTSSLRDCNFIFRILYNYL